MNSDKRDFREISEFVFKILELRDYVNAVNAATRPEVNNDKFVFQVLV